MMRRLLFIGFILSFWLISLILTSCDGDDSDGKIDVSALIATWLSGPVTEGDCYQKSTVVFDADGNITITDEEGCTGIDPIIDTVSGTYVVTSKNQMTATIVETLRDLGVPKKRIHHEQFSL